MSEIEKMPLVELLALKNTTKEQYINILKVLPTYKEYKVYYQLYERKGIALFAIYEKIDKQINNLLLNIDFGSDEDKFHPNKIWFPVESNDVLLKIKIKKYPDYFHPVVYVAGVNMVRQKTIGSDNDKTTYGDNSMQLPMQEGAAPKRWWAALWSFFNRL